MKREPYISVIVPMYKVERYIKVCIDSILAQTFQDFEIIIVDDASPDNCYELCKKLYSSNEKIQIVRHSKNKGLSETRNTGIKNASGKYLFFLDSDDAIVPDAFEKLHKTAEMTDADVIHASGRYQTQQDDDKPFDAQKFTLIWDKCEGEGFLTNDLVLRMNHYWMNSIVHPTAWLCACKRKFLKDRNIKFEPFISEDEFFNFHLLCVTKKYYIMHEALYIYRRRVNSIMGSYNYDRLSKGILALMFAPKYVKRIISAIPELKADGMEEKAIAHFFNLFAPNHVRPFYGNLDNLTNTHKIVFDTFQPVFRENTDFVAHLFSMFNIFRQQIVQLLQQGQNLQQEKQQLLAQLQIANVKMENARLNVIANKIVFINFNGRGYGCNPKYIAEEILRQNLPYDLVWLVSDLSMHIPDRIRKVIFNSIEAIRELSTAKVIITNVKNALPFVKKPDQFLIMTWHGDGGLKYIEKDAEDKLSPQYIAASKENSAITDLILAGSEMGFDEIRRAFWYDGKILKSGLPRNDIFFNSTLETKSQIKANLGIPNSNQVILYAPTFRDNPAISLDVYKLDCNKLLEVMAKRFGGEWTALIRFHPNIARSNAFGALFTPSSNILDVTQYPDIQELIVASDVLISDYSSVISDFTISHKPVFIFAKDIDTYPEERGLKPIYFDLPYAINKTEEELFKCIESFDATVAESKAGKYLDYLRSYDDGHAAERVVEVIKSVIANKNEGDKYTVLQEATSITT